MIERLHRHVHSQLSKYITSIRQRQVFLSLENGFSFKNSFKCLKKLNGYLRLLAIFIKNYLGFFSVHLFVPLVNDITHHKIHGAIGSVTAVALVSSDQWSLIG